MKRLSAATFFVLTSLLICTSAMAQGARPPSGESLPQPSTGRTNDYQPLVLPELPYTVPGRNPPPITHEDRVLKKGLLAPSIDDRVALAAFLRTRNTGLIRLLPREIYDNPSHRKGELAIRGGGAYYSFAMLTHVYGYGSDIELQQSRLSVGFAGADYGMLTSLGDVSLEDISPEDSRAAFIASYKPPRSEQQAHAEARRFSGFHAHNEAGQPKMSEGVTIGGIVYSRSLPVEANATYLLRSIVYDRSDVLVAFRVVRQDADGSVIIAWKLMKEYHAPELIRGT